MAGSTSTDRLVRQRNIAYGVAALGWIALIVVLVPPGQRGTLPVPRVQQSAPEHGVPSGQSAREAEEPALAGERVASSADAAPLRTEPDEAAVPRPGVRDGMPSPQGIPIVDSFTQAVLRSDRPAVLWL